MKIDICIFDFGEPVRALYVDGVLYSYGDEYHNNMRNWIDGFVAGCSQCSIQGVQVETHEFEIEFDTDNNDDVKGLAYNIAVNGAAVPKNLSEIVL